MAQEAYMVVAKRIAWILIGVVVGALTTGSVMGARQRQEQPSSRLVVWARMPIEGKSATLIRDTKSEGCWLMIPSGENSTVLAPAPSGACAVQ
jgi:hypothetical protein